MQTLILLLSLSKVRMNIYNTHVARTTRIQKTGNARPMQGITVKTLITSGAANNVIPPSSSVEDNGIRLEFAQFGHFTSFDVIRSMVSMDSVADADLPTPIATGLKTMYYVDGNVVEETAYYYRVRVWRGSVSFVSNSIFVRTINLSKYRLIHYLDNLLELHGYTPFENSGGVTLTDNGAVFNGVNYLQKPLPFALGSSDFKVSIKFTAQAKPTISDMVIVDAMSNTTALGWQLYVSSGRKVIFYDRARQVGGSATLLESAQINYDQAYKVEVVRVGVDIKMLINDVLVAQKTIPASVTFHPVEFLGVGAQVNSRNSAYDFKGIIKDFRIA